MTEHPDDSELVWDSTEDLSDDAVLSETSEQQRKAVLFEFEDPGTISSADLREAADDLPSVGFNSYPVEHFRGYMGWVDDPSSYDDGDAPTQDAPTDPGHGVWNSAYKKLDDEYGIENWYWMGEYEATFVDPTFGEIEGLYRELYLLPPPGSIS